MKTYPRSRTHPAIMCLACKSKGKPTTVIDGDRVMNYVGIGWIEVRKASPHDKEQYPTLVDDTEAVT